MTGSRVIRDSPCSHVNRTGRTSSRSIGAFEELFGLVLSLARQRSPWRPCSALCTAAGGWCALGSRKGLSARHRR